MPAVNSIPTRERLSLLGEIQDEAVENLIFAVANHDGPNVFLNVGLVVHIGPVESLFVLFDFVELIILNKVGNTSRLI
jgi:hypothetical protein